MREASDLPIFRHEALGEGRLWLRIRQLQMQIYSLSGNPRRALEELEAILTMQSKILGEADGIRR